MSHTGREGGSQSERGWGEVVHGEAPAQGAPVGLRATGLQWQVARVDDGGWGPAGRCGLFGWGLSQVTSQVPLTQWNALLQAQVCQLWEASSEPPPGPPASGGRDSPVLGEEGCRAAWGRAGSCFSLSWVNQEASVNLPPAELSC